MGTFRREILAVLAAGVLSLALLAGCGGPNGVILVNARCASCHRLTVVTNSKKSAAEWDKTVTRMIKHGANLSDAEKKVLLDYLAKNYGP